MNSDKVDGKMGLFDLFRFLIQFNAIFKGAKSKLIKSILAHRRLSLDCLLPVGSAVY